MIKMCCVCRRVEHKGEWLKQPDSGSQGVSHVYCPPCYEGLMEEIDRFALKQWSKSVYTVINGGHLLGA